ncbi:MAG TPA: hypothetical protein VMV10_26380 [Pirellulales bacterium]|nr:hypothetical protein [Pirellulales bacterium]
MLEFHVEWLEAPGVANRVLAETWARLTATAVDLEGDRHLLTRLLSTAARSEREGIYGSVFPLAEWIVENWWFILAEPARMPELPSGRRLAGFSPEMREWATRHNLLAARHGGALPDVSLYCDHDHIVAKWRADPEVERNGAPVRFIGEGEARLSREDVEQGLEAFVLQVISRLEGAQGAEVEHLRTEWSALCDSRKNEEDLCTWAASMGLDPYDAFALSDDIIDLLERELPSLEPELRTDLVEATSAKYLSLDLDWLSKARRKTGASAEMTNGFDWSGGITRPKSPKIAHEWGYQRAVLFRSSVRLEPGPIPDLPELLHRQCHWSWDADQIVERSGPTRVSGMVTSDSQGRPRVIWPGASGDSARFLLARALFFVPLLHAGETARLVTKAHTWEQAASRAFAAELLAPADALRAEFSGGIGQEELQAAANRFAVSTMVIEHQIKNRQIGWIEDC